MKTEWDYSHLAKAYVKRPEYSDAALKAAYQFARLEPGAGVCDVGAGVAHLTLALLKAGFQVDAVEPNDEMRKIGTNRTTEFSQVQWFEGTGEETGRPSRTFDAVTFGSSFNVTDRPKALKETARILKPGGFFICLWNHRVLNDPIQSAVEGIISKSIPGYNYGTRREDQTKIINDSGLFGPVSVFDGGVTHEVSTVDFVEAWRSHATLDRQAGSKFQDIISDIAQFCRELNRPSLLVPYTTRVWAAQLQSN